MHKTIWISHRGYCKEAMENTRKSFDAALALGFTHFETDLRTTADGTIVLQHNATLDHTCRLGHCVETSDWSALKDVKTSDDQHLMTLTELYEHYKSYQWTLDIKGPGDRRTLDHLVLWAREHQAEEWLETHTRFLLWSRKTEKHALQLFPNVLTLAQEPECYQAGVFALCRLPALGKIQKGRTYSIPPHLGKIKLFTKSILAAYHSRGARLLAYLPERDEDAKNAYLMGFDEILTNGRKLF